MAGRWTLALQRLVAPMVSGIRSGNMVPVIPAEMMTSAVTLAVLLVTVLGAFMSLLMTARA